MNKVNRRSLLLFSLLIALLIQLGDWNGQINKEESTKGNTNALFLMIFVPILLVIVRVANVHRYVAVFLPVRKQIVFFFVASVILGLCREDLAMSLRSIASIISTYMVVFSLAALSFAIPFSRVVDILIIFITFVFLPVTVYVHVTTVGPLMLFPDRAENNNLRLGGLIYYAHTAMLLGIAGVWALYQFLRHNTTQHRLYYGITFLWLNIFLLFTDCRSSWGGVAFAYCVIVLSGMPMYKRKLIIGSMAVIVLLIQSGIFKVNAHKRSNMNEDVGYRTAIWGFAVQGISERPLTGYGSQNYFKRNRGAMNMDDRVNDPHSATLALALQSGLVIVLLFYGLYIRVARHYYRFAVAKNKALIAVSLFWFFVPFFWGHIYDGVSGFIQVMFPLSYFVSLLHPELYWQRPVQQVPNANRKLRWSQANALVNETVIEVAE